MIKPFKSGYLPVTDGHKLYYEVCGNPKGTPCLFLHGGPGTGFNEHHKEVFNPKTQMIILFDQRGSSKSKPFASLKANTAFKSCQDIDTLLNYLNVDQVVTYGGSWGSTLSLAYAIRSPKRVKGMVLRGVFLSRKEGYEHYMGGGLGKFAPDLWEEFLELVPKNRRRNPAGYYAERIQNGSPSIRKKYAKAWASFELKAAFLEPLSEKEVDELLKMYSYESFAKLESHYINKKCFLPDNYLLKNAKKIKHIPLRIIQGKYDLLCPPKEAHDLAKCFTNVEVHYPISGHVDPRADKVVKKKITELCKL